MAAGGRIVVHGDYDVDGICATALAVETLRDLGADVAWHLPSRFAEGYGVAVETVDALADAGAALLLTVDCGISAADAVARARARGLDVVVTDHHRPGEVWPDAPVVAARGPHEGRYPDGELCGTGVVFKLAQALYARRQGGAPRGRDPGAGGGARPGGPGHGGRRRAAVRREPRARASGPPPAGARDEARPGGADALGLGRPRPTARLRLLLPARPAAQCRRPPGPSGRGARAPPHPRRRSRRGRSTHAGGAQPRAPGDRGGHRPGGRRPGRGGSARPSAGPAPWSCGARVGTRA